MIRNHHVQPSERDYIQGIAEEAIWHAAKKFDMSYQAFIPYLRRVMELWVERALCHSFIIYIPEEIRRQIWRLENFMRRTGGEKNYGGLGEDRYAWTDERKRQVMEEISVDEDGLMDLIAWSVLAGVEPLLENELSDSLSEEGTVSDKNSEMIDETADVEGQCIENAMQKAIRDAVDKHCTKEEAEVLSTNFGLDEGPGMSQEKTAKEMTRRHGEEFTKTDVRCILRQALRKLGKAEPELKEFLD